MLKANGLDQIQVSLVSGDDRHSADLTLGLAWFHGEERRAWSDGFDMVSLNPSNTPNILERVLHSAFLALFDFLNRGRRAKLSRRMQNGLDRSEELEIEKARESFVHQRYNFQKLNLYLVGILQSAAAAAIPGVSILILYEVHDLRKRIYVLLGLAILFAIVVRIVTMRRDVEIFGVTAA
jgi:hypothetical protein